MIAIGVAALTSARLSGAVPVAGRKPGFGAAIRADDLARDPRFRAALLAECGWFTPETDLKWAAIEALPGQLDFAAADAIAAFAREGGRRLHGHALLWHRSIPDWAAFAVGEQSDWAPVRAFFASTMPRFSDVIDSWDVVNEPIDTGHRMDGLRETPFLAGFGPDYIRRALEEARLFAPRARLMLNEFGFEYDLPVERDRRWLFLRLVERLKREGAPLDAVGMQAHLDLAKGSVAERSIAEFVRELAGFGLAITVSELDVKEHDYALPVEQRDQRVADAVRHYLDVVLANPAVESVTCWGLSDRHSWLKVEPADYARLGGLWQPGEGPGLNRGLPLDAALNPKPFHRVLRNALASSR